MVTTNGVYENLTRIGQLREIARAVVLHLDNTHIGMLGGDPISIPWLRALALPKTDVSFVPVSLRRIFRRRYPTLEELDTEPDISVYELRRAYGRPYVDDAAVRIRRPDDRPYFLRDTKLTEEERAAMTEEEQALHDMIAVNNRDSVFDSLMQ